MRTLILRAWWPRAAHTVCSTWRMSPVPTTSTFSDAHRSVGGRHDEDDDDNDEAEEDDDDNDDDDDDEETRTPVRCASSDGVKPHI